MALYQGLLHNLFGVPADVHIRGIKVGKSLGEELVHHGIGLLQIDLIANHGQTHQAEPQLFHVLAQITHI